MIPVCPKAGPPVGNIVFPVVSTEAAFVASVNPAVSLVNAGDGKSTKGSLLLVATPIGNLGDLSERSRDALRSCDLLACEDTRVTAKLLVHVGVKVETTSLEQDQNETSKLSAYFFYVGFSLFGATHRLYYSILCVEEG